MTKKIIYQERIMNQFWGGGKFLMWECGCSDIIFFDNGLSLNRKLCDNNHARMDVADRRDDTEPPEVIIR